MDRLRRLDALFAERVLGWEVGGLNDHTRPLHDPVPNDPDLRDQGGDLFADFSGKGGHRYLTRVTQEGYTQCISLCGCDWNRDLWRMVELPHYTRSLDAAWEGVAALIARKDKCFLFDGLGYRCCDHDEDGWHGKYRAWFACKEDEDGAKRIDTFATADHPAEALVLACLRAVGCSEEELNG